MSAAESTDACESSTPGQLNYLSDELESSLFRNGQLLTRRDADGSDGETHGYRHVTQSMSIRDGRLLKEGDRCTLDRNGFELVADPCTPPDLDFLDQQQVVERYYAACAALVEASTGAQALAFDHNVRSAGGKRDKRRITGGQEVQGPAHVVHGDYTLTSAPTRLRDLARPPGQNDTLRRLLGGRRSLLDEGRVEDILSGDGRFALINVWRNIAPEPVATHPMALCDSQTVEPDDLVVFEIHYEDRIGENYFAKHADRHRWTFFPSMTRDEALLIKQWDSAGPLARSRGEVDDASEPDSPCTFSFHSAFKDPATPEDAPDRWSIEVRCVVLYPAAPPCIRSGVISAASSAGSVPRWPAAGGGVSNARGRLEFSGS